MEASSAGVLGSFSLPQSNESALPQGLGHLPPYGFRNNDQDSDQLQADRSHLLFGVSIDQPLVGSSTVVPHTYGKAKDVTGNNMLSAAYGPPTTPDSLSNGLMSSEGLDENGLFQRNPGWSAMPAATPLRTFTKVFILTSALWKAFVGNFLHLDFSCSARPVVNSTLTELPVFMFSYLKNALCVKGVYVIGRLC